MADINKVMGKLDYLEDTKLLMKDAINDKGQNITSNTAFREYVQIIKMISDGDVKVYKSRDEMEQDETIKNNDILMVYDEELNIFNGLYRYTDTSTNIHTINAIKNIYVDSLSHKLEYTETAFLNMENTEITVRELSPDTVKFPLDGLSKIEYTKHTIDKIIMYPNKKDLIQINDNLYILSAIKINVSKQILENELDKYKIHRYTYDIKNRLFKDELIDVQIIEFIKNEESIYYIVGDEIQLTDEIINWKYTNSLGTVSNINIYAPNILGIEIETAKLTYAFENKKIGTFDSLQTQLNAEDNSYVITDSIAYGKNGIVVGDGSYLKHTTMKELKDKFLKLLPNSYSTNAYFDTIITAGSKVPYCTFVQRQIINESDISTLTDTNSYAIVSKTDAGNTTFYKYSVATTLPCDGDMFITWPKDDINITLGETELYNSYLTSEIDFSGTVTPEEYTYLLNISRDILGV